jgi:hypothetical protein
MDLKKIGISKDLWEALIKIQSDNMFKDYYLAGGTAFSLHIGHRISTDIDLFSKSELNKEETINFIKENISNDVIITNESKNILQLLVDDKTKIDFVKYPYDLLDTLIKTEGIRLIDKNDISAMKISAIGTRGDEAKDFVDIFYMMKYMSLEKMFENFQKKYNTNDILHYKRSLVYFDDVPEESWENIKMLYDKLSIREVKKTITDEVSKLFYTSRKVDK